MQIFHYLRPYRRPLQLKQGLFQYREGLLLEVDGDWGEVAPFPGLSRESLDDCLQALKAGSPERWPATAWGCYMLQNPLEPSVFLSEARPVLPVNALLPGGQPSELLTLAEQRYAQGYRCLKLKVGLNTPETERHLIETLLDRLPGIRLRLDANRSWDLRTALDWWLRLPADGIEYLEEPLSDPKEYEALLEAGCPLALDEALGDPRWDVLIPSLKALVLKPMILGPQRFQECLSQAREAGIPVVFSSVFESGLSLRYLALLALQQPGKPLAAGLDTWRVFEDDLFVPAFETDQGEINFSARRFTDGPDLRLKWVRKLF